MLLVIIIVCTLGGSLNHRKIDLIYRLLMEFGLGLMTVIFGILAAKEKDRKNKITYKQGINSKESGAPMLAFLLEFIAGMLSGYFQETKTSILKISTICFFVFFGSICIVVVFNENHPFKSGAAIAVMIGLVLALTAITTAVVWCDRKFYKQKKTN